MPDLGLFHIASPSGSQETTVVFPELFRESVVDFGGNLYPCRNGIMIIIVPQQPGFDWVGWLQVLAAFLGVLIASLIAIYVANKQHKMQVKHQMRMDVARFSTSYKRAHDNGSILYHLADYIARGTITNRNATIEATKTEIHEAVAGAQEVWRTLKLYAQPEVSEATLTVLGGLEDLAEVSLQIFDETKNQQFYQEAIPKKYEPVLAELLTTTRVNLDDLFEIASSKESRIKRWASRRTSRALKQRSRKDSTTTELD